MAHLDKFKRRLIRSVARLMLREKKPEAEVWEELKKETGCECEALWGRMKALTLKKLDRLLVADDRTENIAAVARLSLTDWLLFDMVLVHEKIDVIARDKTAQRKVEYKPLMELFSLVQRFEIEGRSGDSLAQSWAAATVHYNQNGRQCSPMLLQRRWYQMKEATRSNFYKFWLHYRGKISLLLKAKDQMPTVLQIAIARRYPKVITEQFLEWEDLIKHELVILPDKFEGKMNMNNPPKLCEANDQEVIAVERVIETIELNCDSDTEDNSISNNNQDTIGSECAALVDVELKNISTNVDLGITIKQEIDEIEELSYSESIPVNSREKLKNTIKSVEASLEKANIKVEMAESLNGTDLDDKINPLDSKEELNKTLESVKEIFKKSDLHTANNSSKFINDIETGKNYDKQLIDSSNTILIDTVESEKDLLHNASDVTDVPDITNSKTCINLSDSPILPEGECSVSNNRERQLSEINNLRGTSLKITKVRSDGVLPKISNIIGNAKFLETQVTKKTAPSIVEECDIRNEESSKVIYLCNDDENNINLPHVVNNLEVKSTKTAEYQETLPTDDEAFLQDIIDLKTSIELNNLEKLRKQTKNSKSVIAIEQNTLNAALSIPNLPNTQVMQRENVDVGDITKVKTETSEESKSSEQSRKLFEYHVPIDLTIVDDGIEFVDDGINYEEDGDKSDSRENNSEKSTQISNEDQDVSGFDAKLFMTPVVYTLKLDKMDVFKTGNFNFVTGKNIIDKIITESKPVSPNTFDDNSDINVDNIHDDDECETDDDSNYGIISDHQKVKTNSCFLQKPRNRSYNPIQLCKNPDFNTRLKRLNVGFFSSTRNRLLLKNCKPLTIDVHKAFESKLINGTLYLKTDKSNTLLLDESVTGDKDRETVTVLPSAMPVQSLINNTKFQDLMQSHNREYETSKIYEKNIQERRKIHLPDITSVRRINQQLLTAQVTPIVIQSNSDENSTNPPNILSQQVPPIIKHKENEESAVVGIDSRECSSAFRETVNNELYESSNQVKISHISEINVTNIADIEVTPVETKQIPTQDNSKSNDTVPLIQNKHILSHANGTSNDLVRMQCQGNISENNKTAVEIIIDTPVISHNLVPNDTSSKANAVEKKEKRKLLSKRGPDWRDWRKPLLKPLDDALLTIDTLDKMLHVLCGGKPDMIMSKSEKKKLKNDKSITIKKQTNEDTVAADTVNVSQSSKTRNIDKETNKPDRNSKPVNSTHSTIKPKINILTAKKRNLEELSCCWARHKLNNTLKLPVHRCPLPICHCCCRDLLVKNTLSMYSKKHNENNESQTIVLSDDEDTLKKACESIETVVQESRKMCETGSEHKILNFTLSDNKLPSDNLSVFKIDCNDTITVVKDDCLQENQIETNTSNSSLVLNKKINQTSSESNDTSPVNIELNMLTPKKTQDISNKQEDKQTLFNVRQNCKVNFISSDKNQSSKEKKSRQRKNLQNSIPNVPILPKKPIISIVNKSREIVIDATGMDIGMERNIEEKRKVLYLNSNQLKHNTSAPIYVGENKILLTTVKLPNTKSSTYNITMMDKNDKNKTPLMELPTGVQMVLLPNGELTYVVDPSVELHPSQLESLPIILSSVQEQLNNKLISNTELHKDNVNQENDYPALSTPNNELIVNPISNMDNCEPCKNKSSEVNTDKVIEVNRSVRKINTMYAIDESETSVEVHSESGESNTRAQDPNAGNSINAKDSELNLDKDNVKICGVTNEVTKDSEVSNDGIENEGKKTILSDLMAMSGISAEDSMSVAQETTPVISISEIPEQIQAVPINLLNRANSEPINVVCDTNIIDSGHSLNTLELTPVTSFADLKYAYEHYGKFYNLNLETSLIQPMNVCIQKIIKNNTINHEIALNPDSVVDLTDDGTEVPRLVKLSNSALSSENTSHGDLRRYLSKKKKQANVQPVKMFKAVHSVVIRRKRKLHNVNEHERDKKSNKKMKKPCKIETKIDLVDSDAPMEEEYLVDSTDSDDSIIVEKTLKRKVISEESDSDDEPLSTIIKRRNEAETDKSTVQINSEKSITSINQSEAPSDTTELQNVNVEKEKKEETKILTKFRPINLEFFTDSENEDCILGV